jgi:MFS family permease
MRPANPMPESPYEVLGLFTGAMVGASLFIMATGALAPILESVFNIGPTQLGLVLSVQLVGALLTTAIAGMLTDRFGDKKMVFWTGLFMGSALICASLVTNYHWLLFWLFIYGIGFAAVTPAGCHAIIFFFKKEDRGFAMGVRQCGVPLAGIIGSLLLPAIALRFHYESALVTAGVLTIAACTLASLLYRQPKELSGERVAWSAMFKEMLVISRDARLILMTLVCMVLICAQMVLMAFLALAFVHQAEFTTTLAVAFFTLSQVAAMFGRLSWGWSSDHLFSGSRALPLAVVCVLTAAIALAFSFVSPATSLWVDGLLAVSLGFCAEGWFGVGAIGLAEIGGEEHAGSSLGVGLTWSFLAAFIAPALFGALSEVNGFAFAWRALALLEIVGIVPALLSTILIERAIAGKKGRTASAA